MKIEIPFEVGDMVWFIHPKLLKATHAKLKSIKTHTEDASTKIKYNMDVPLIGGSEEVYVWSIFETKEKLLQSL